MYAIGFAVAFVMFSLTLVVLEWMRKRERRARSLLRPTNAPHVVRLATGAVTSDMFPITRDLPLANAEIRAVGGNYISSARRRFLREGLVRWVGAGADVEYIVAAPGNENREQLERLQEEIAAMSLAGSFRVKFCVCTPRDARGDLCQRYKTFHPTLFRLAGGERAMWIEANHPVDSIYAHGIEYLSPAAMRAEPERRYDFEALWQDIDTLACSAISSATEVDGPASRQEPQAA